MNKKIISFILLLIIQIYLVQINTSFAVVAVNLNSLTFMDGSVNPLTFVDGSVNPIMYINTNQLSEDYCQLTHRGGYIMCDAYFRIESTKNENVNNIIQKKEEQINKRQAC